jgi:hypothetical protein
MRDAEADYVYEAACSGLRYKSPGACGEVSAIWLDGKRWPVSTNESLRLKRRVEELEDENRRLRGGRIWECDHCGQQYSEYCNGCPKCDKGKVVAR